MLEATTSELATLRWYLALTTPAEKQTDANSEFNIAASFGRLLSENTLIFPRIAHSFRVEGGEQSDPEAGPDLSGPANGSFRLDGDGKGRFGLDDEHALLFDAGSGTIAITRGDRVVPIWGQERDDGQGGSRHSFHDAAHFELDTGTRVSIEAAPAPDHANAVSPSLVTIVRGGDSVSLIPVA